MKVNGPGGATPAAPAASRRPASGAFSLSAGADAREVVAASTASGVAAATMDALIALQATPTALERRRRAVNRAGRLLDVLDEIKLGLLDGGGSIGALERLRDSVREQRDGTDDPRLEGVLDEIETRAAVELAKQEVARGQ
jgi:hypothetical protein